MRNHGTFRRRLVGFTLIELLTVMAIVAVLAAVAYPAYTAQVNRTRRAEAQAVMLEAAQYLERHYSANGSYTDAVLPARLSAAPMGAAANQRSYDITLLLNDTLTQGVATSSGASYTLTAAPTRSDPCGTLVLVNSGAKSAQGTGMAASDCWR